MASKERKVSLGRKQNAASPVPPKESTPTDVTKTSPPKPDQSTAEESTKAPVKATKLGVKSNAIIAKKMRQNAAKKAISKTIKINLKAKNKTRKITKLESFKNVVKNNSEMKKNLLKNGVKRAPKKVEAKQEAENEEDGTEKVKKRVVRKVNSEAAKKQKSEEVSPKSKRKTTKKAKEETLDEVINDLTFLIKEDDIKKEVDSLSESSKSDNKVPVPKKVVKRTKVNLLKQKIKQENIENSLSKINTEEKKKVIDVLDLNVHINKASPIKSRRRHSIEKFPIGSLENVETVQTFFSSLPIRSLSPKGKRSSKTRLSVDSKRASPYTTRSDTPTRILRNGKHRLMKSVNLVDGLETTDYKKRKRLCSEYSGSEVSKNSGYESDSSFSDLASLHGAENCENPSESSKELEESKPVECVAVAEEDKKPPPLNGEENFTDTNSNLCQNAVKPKVEPDKLNSPNDYIESVTVSPSAKVPEKSLILDIMKQTFNETAFDDKKVGKKSTSKASSEGKVSPPTVTTLSFYGTGSEKADEPSEEVTEEELPKEELPKEDCVSTCEEEKENHDQTNGEQVAEEVKEMSVEEIVEEEAPKESTEESEVLPITENKEETDLEESIPAIVEEAKEEETQLVEVEPAEKIEEAPEENSDSNNKIIIEETPEERAIKEDMLNALGLRSKQAAEEEKQKKSKAPPPKNESYTGTLKTVIKLNRTDKKKGRQPSKITLQKKKTAAKEAPAEPEEKSEESNQKVPKENSSSWKAGKESSESAGALRKSHYFNRSNMDASSEHTSDGDTGPVEEGAAKSLVIPEKASSFSIHPGRLCKDECTYCFGKFGLFDTPCHIATLKSVERQDKILAAEKHLQRDSCLCDACFRHVDRKSNAPSYANKSLKRNNLVAPTPKENHCHVLNCGQLATNILRRKWIIKMRKNICEVMNIDLNNPGLHSIPICEEHYMALEHLMVCAMCKRRLTRNHVHYLGPEITELNVILNKIGVPVTLADRPVVCKLCRYFSMLALKDDEDIEETAAHFFEEYKKRLLHFHDVEPMAAEDIEEPLPVPVIRDKLDKEQLKKRKRAKASADEQGESQDQESKENVEKKPRVPSATESRSESPSDYMIDYNTLIPNIAMECGEGSDSDANKKQQKTASIILKKIPKPETVKEAVEISKNINKLKQRSDIAVQRLGSNPSISVRQLFPGEEELPLQGSIDFANVKERTPEGWEKCNATIQYDNDTKLLWQELQKPYGNQSSFLRHLILLEKYFRNGDLILSPNASHHSVNYSESVQNRLRAYDNIPSNIPPANPPNMVPFSKQKSLSGIITSKETTVSVSVTNAANIPKNTPITITQMNNHAGAVVYQNIKPKPASLPPGLMPLMPGTTRPVAPLIKVPQSQKIKFPVTKNWRPNLIPIDPNKKLEKKPGLVQVISGGKPYHITVEDYKKMCAIKRTFDLRQKRLQEQKANPSPPGLSVNQQGNSLLKPRKGLVISKSSTVTSPKSENAPEQEGNENILERLDRQVEKIEKTNSAPPLILPKIPKSLTVIPQSVPRKPSRPSSPVLLITQKSSKPVANKS